MNPRAKGHNFLNELCMTCTHCGEDNRFSVNPQTVFGCDSGECMGREWERARYVEYIDHI